MLYIYIFIDAFGWELFKKNSDFLKDIVITKKPLRTVFGYSSACVPSIITGKTPAEHGFWSSFYYSPETSPFRLLKHLDLLPKFITDKSRVRRYLSKILKKICGFSGYFEIYNAPFKYLPYFDYQEKYDIYAENGIKGHETVFDILREQNIPYFLAKDRSDKIKFEKLNESLEEGKIKFAYLHLGELDSLLHFNKKDSSVVKEKLEEYKNLIMKTYENAKKHYNEVSLVVFSDHGMKEIDSTYDLIKDIESLGLIYGKDYIAFYDSTMARFWFLNESANDKIANKLNQIKEGSVLSEEELKAFGGYFQDHKYGDLIFLMKPGTLIVPSFMGKKPLCGMHGYHPEDPDSWAMYLSNRDEKKEIKTILDVFDFKNLF